MAKKSDKKKSSKGKDSRKAGKTDRQVAAGTEAIAKAERRLESTLHKLDDVRAELSEREAALRDLLVRHGRMPAEDPDAETVPMLDQRQVTHPLEGLSEGGSGPDEAIASVPLLDQEQVADVGSRDPVEHEN